MLASATQATVKRLRLFWSVLHYKQRMELFYAMSVKYVKLNCICLSTFCCSDVLILMSEVISQNIKILSVYWVSKNM